MTAAATTGYVALSRKQHNLVHVEDGAGPGDLADEVASQLVRLRAVDDRSGKCDRHRPLAAAWLCDAVGICGSRDGSASSSLRSGRLGSLRLGISTESISADYGCCVHANAICEPLLADARLCMRGIHGGSPMPCVDVDRCGTDVVHGTVRAPAQQLRVVAALTFFLAQDARP